VTVINRAQTTVKPTVIVIATDVVTKFISVVKTDPINAASIKAAAAASSEWLWRAVNRSISVVKRAAIETKIIERKEYEKSEYQWMVRMECACRQSKHFRSRTS
jgi:hypothetical protein